MLYEGAPKVFPDAKLEFDRVENRVPTWCGLPVPGMWALEISATGKLSRLVKIDTKRMYTIASQSGSDIVVSELNKGIKIRIFHHRDGLVYINADIGPSKLLEIDLIDTNRQDRVSLDPIIFPPGSDLVISDTLSIRLVAQDGGHKKVSVREALRCAQTDDEATRRNTAINCGKSRKVKRESPAMNNTTPLSGYRPKRKEQKFHDENRAVKFLDFSNI